MKRLFEGSENQQGSVLKQIISFSFCSALL